MKQTRLLTTLLATAMATALSGQATAPQQMERLDRGVVALPSTSSGIFVSWRLFGTDNLDNTTFDLLRDDTAGDGTVTTKVVAKDLAVTNYRDSGGKATSMYRVVTKTDGLGTDTTAAVGSLGQQWLKVPLDRPAAGKTKPYTTTINKETVSYPSGQDYTYAPNDCSVGDVDGDGQYEIFVKWEPSNAKDNSQNGVTGNVYLDCYKLDGTKLWRVDLGKNIRAGAHYTQYLVYDFDGDGRAELMCKTAPGTVDGQGNYVSEAATDPSILAVNNAADHVSEGAGRINSGHEYLTVFEGLTGKAIHTIAYNPNRNAKSELSTAAGTFNWGGGSKNDTGSYGNRGERYLAAVAALGGPAANPSAIFCRGYYTFAYIWAVDFDGQHLIPKWLHRSDSTTKYSVTDYDADGHATTKSYTPGATTSGGGSKTMYSNGNHNMTVGDVDGDGCDEIVWGSAALDSDGTLLYATGFGHGDAIHMGSMIPGRPGLQVFQVHEEKGTYAWDLHDAATGEIIYKGGPEGVDNGRGMAAQLSAKNSEYWFSSASERAQRSAKTGEVASTASGSVNFRMYWDGTTQDALLDGSAADKFSDTDNKFNRLVTFYNMGPGSTCNGTKNTPNLLADIFGDWREEIVLHSVSDQETYLGIYTTNIVTKYAVPTLMHDHTYRMAVAWQNTAYNQPPHLGYNLADSMMPRLRNAERDIYANLGDSVRYFSRVNHAKSVILNTSILPDGTKKTFAAPDGFTFEKGKNNTSLTLKGLPTEAGDYAFVIKLTGLGSESVIDTLRIHVNNTTGIMTIDRNGPSAMDNGQLKRDKSVYDLQGRKVCRKAKGLCIEKRMTENGIVTRKKLLIQIL